MLKKCPTCNRTYADETISFCLADGALLSAPYDSAAPPPTRAEGREPPTEVLPAPTPPTQPEKPGAPTITAAFATPVRSTLAENKTAKTGSKPVVIVAVLALFVIGALVVGFVLLNSWRTRRTEVASAGNENVNALIDIPTETPTNSPTSSTTPTPFVTPRSTPTVRPATLDSDSALFPPDRRELKYGDPKAESTPSPRAGENDNRVFNGREVDQKARILERPEPTYTEEARKNQVTGTVVLRGIFAANGQVIGIHVVSGLTDGLSERAVAAARRIRFTPAIKDGRPVSMYFQLEYNFNLY